MPYMLPNRAFVVEESTFLAKASSSGLQLPHSLLHLAFPKLEHSEWPQEEAAHMHDFVTNNVTVVS
jgi:hypothetical protein